MTEDRVALHERMALAKWEGYAKAIERNRHCTFGEEFIYAPNAVITCPLFNGGAAQSITDLFSDEVAAAAATHAPDGDILTPEWRMWWKYMPDYSLVSPFECIAGDWGFSSHDTYAGTLPDGTVLKLQEWDYIWTNGEGHVTRWDWFVDSGEWNPFLALIGLDPSGVTYQDYTINYLHEGGVGS